MHKPLSPISIASPQDQARLTRMKRMATGLLGLMAIIFVLTSIYAEAWAGLAYIQAFSEAAMIGALADWFAVTALFRHPLGLPIPHTAIVPKHKDRIADRLAEFVRSNFLTRAAVTPRLQRVDLAGTIGRWLEQPQNAARIAEDARAVLRWLVNMSDEKALRTFVQKQFDHQLQKAEATPLIARVLELLSHNNYHQAIIDELLLLVRDRFADNKEALRAQVGRESPWWLPGFVDGRIYRSLVEHIEELLIQVSVQDDHVIRREINDLVQNAIARFREDPGTIAQGEKIKNDILKHPVMRKYLADIGQQVIDYVGEEVSGEKARLKKRLQQGIIRFATEMQENEPIREQVNGWLRSIILHIIENYSGDISSIISETARNWDGAEMARAAEGAVGRDLQFIRINGTLVGGIVGLTIFMIAHNLF